MRRTLLGPLLVSAAAAASVAVIGCGSSRRLPPQTHASPRVELRADHIAVVVMENEEYADIIGSQQTPFINGLAHRYALSTQSYAISHPSLPNYLALAGGTTFGIDSDCTDCSVPGGGVAAQLTDHGLTWKGYMEDLPHPCFSGDSAGDYAKKHDPFIYFRGIANDPLACARIVPLTQLAADERADRLPTLTWVTPNLCHDMHDCSPATGDRFLSTLIPPLLRALGPHGLLILTWDEGSSDDGCCRLAAGGHVATVLAGPLARLGARSRTPLDHYSVQQAIEDLTGLQRIQGAACPCTSSLAPLLRRPSAPARTRRGARQSPTK